MHMVKTVRHFFPHIAQLMGKHVTDLRDNRGKAYSMHEALMSVIMMFLLKEGSRNSYNQDRAEPKFNRNIRRLLKVNLMHGDSFNDVLSNVDEDDLQQLKASLVKVLIVQKVLYPFRHGDRYIVAIDGTGTHSFSDDYCGTCLSKTSKNEVTTYSHAVLEAKLVAANGFCISLASEWMENNERGEHDKQDCELKAFKRLAEKIKKLYPRLPLIVVADALYGNTPVMDICKNFRWNFILVIKEGILKDLNEEISLRPDKTVEKTQRGKLAWLNDLKLDKHPLSWFRWEEAGNCFSWITNMPIRDAAMVVTLQQVARLRWKIENEGFNTQKNLGYNLEHKYSRIDFNATKNYYQCMQIAHLIEQLTLLSNSIHKLIPAKISIIKICERIRNSLALINIDLKPLELLLEKKIQIRYVE